MKWTCSINFFTLYRSTWMHLHTTYLIQIPIQKSTWTVLIQSPRGRMLDVICLTTKIGPRKQKLKKRMNKRKMTITLPITVYSFSIVSSLLIRKYLCMLYMNIHVFYYTVYQVFTMYPFTIYFFLRIKCINVVYLLTICTLLNKDVFCEANLNPLLYDCTHHLSGIYCWVIHNDFLEHNGYLNDGSGSYSLLPIISTFSEICSVVN